MVGTHRRRLQRQRQKEKTKQLSAAAAFSELSAAAIAKFHHLPPELLAEIHPRLDFLHRLAFASVCGGGGHNLKMETPWLLSFPLPPTIFPPAETNNNNPNDREPAITTNATVLSLADGNQSATVRTSENTGLRGHFTVIGSSSGGWLVTVDDKAALRMANPVTGAHADLPAITTVPCIHAFGRGDWKWFCLYMDPFLKIRFAGGENPPPPLLPENGGDDGSRDLGRSYTLTADQMRQQFYRKVILSDSPSSRSPTRYEAMLIMERAVGAPAFATAEDPVWRIAPSHDGVEDAIFHDGRFHSISYTGHVEAWQRDVITGEFVAVAVGPRMAYEHENLRRKYIAVSPEGRLMVVLKHAREVDKPHRQYWSNSKDTRISFKVQVLDGDNGGRWWEEADDIGAAAIFVGVNGSLCLSTKEHKGIRPGCVYFTGDEQVSGSNNNVSHHEKMSSSTAYYSNDQDRVVNELRGVGVYSLKTRRVDKIAGLAKHLLWPTPVWFRPSFL